MMVAEQTSDLIMLHDLLEGMVPVSELVNDNTAISRLCIDNRLLQKGDLFLAVKGLKQDALQFVGDAINSGAAAVAHESVADMSLQKIAAQHRVPLIYDPQLSQHLGIIASRFYGEPSKCLQLVGVTGTDGKTSVSHFIANSLSFLEAGTQPSCGLIGTLGNGAIGRLDPASHTTPDALELQNVLAQMRAEKLSFAVVEASSHGLDQGRVNGVEFNVAVLTNLGRDHLDYHQDIEAYKNAKHRLFRTASLKAAVVNVHDPFGLELLAAHSADYPVSLYGIGSINKFRSSPIFKQAADWVLGDNLSFNDTGFSVDLVTDNAVETVQCNLIGEFNVLNVLATVATLRALDFPLNDIALAVQTLKTVAGRMQYTKAKGRPAVVVDYAHTPQALEAALKALRQHCQGKLWCVFGCGGDRDIGKRPQMGGVAERYADNVILTDDNPRSENPKQIIDAIMGGIQNTSQVQRIHDRKDAITTAIQTAGNDDWVLLAGKGHENYQEVQGHRKMFSDLVLVQQMLVGEQ